MTSLISPEIVDVLNDTTPDILGDAPRILLQGRHDHAGIFATVTPDVLMNFLGRVLNGCAAHVDGGPFMPAVPATPERDAALVHGILHCLARWPAARGRAVEAWQLALNLHLLGTAGTDMRA